MKTKLTSSLSLVAFSLSCLSAFAIEPQITAIVDVDAAKALGPIRIMHAVNNGPAVKKPLGDQKRGNFNTYKAARFPYARTHDSINCCPGGAHCCDIAAIFPDFDADENDPKNYDFVFTDHYLDSTRRTGTQIFFRLGQTIEHGPKKYGVLPPKDYAKWARICEHVIRHYNEGWGWNLDREWTTQNIAWSNQFNIVYWEIWNEPDLDRDYVTPPKNPRTWGGTVTNFFEFFETAAKHLKKTFPALKIGGPALCGSESWDDDFLHYCRDHKVPLDFHSWHVYATEPGNIAAKADRIRTLMDKYGYEKAESILDEWNYVKGWTDDFVHSIEVESGRFNQKGAAFIAATFADCQYHPVDMLMFYDARVGCSMNNLFSLVTLWPLKGYYPFYAWSKMVDRGTQVACSVREGRGTYSAAATGVKVEKVRGGDAAGQFRAVAAKGADGSVAIFIARYSSDDNTTDTGRVWVKLPGIGRAKSRCFVTDAVRTHTEIPLEPEGDDLAAFDLQPNSFALIEL